MKEHSSPEERLLSIIKGVGKKEPAFQTGVVLPPAQIRKEAILKKGKLLSEIKAGRYEIKTALGRAITDRVSVFERLNKGLLVICCLLIAGIAVMIKSLEQGHGGVTPDYEFLQENADSPNGQEVKPFSYYDGLIAKKGLFKIAQEEVKKEIRPSAAQAGPLELLSNYSLSGVVSGERPQAIIEDKKAQKTYFLNKGQYLGEFRIDDIMEGKVIFDFNGQKFELSL